GPLQPAPPTMAATARIAATAGVAATDRRAVAIFISPRVLNLESTTGARGRLTLERRLDPSVCYGVMYLKLSMTMSTMYCAEPVPLQGSAQAIPMRLAGFGLSPVYCGGRLPPVRSVQWIVCVADMLVSEITFDGAAQVPSYCDVVGAHVPHVMLPSAVW